MVGLSLLANVANEPPPGTDSWLRILLYLLGAGVLVLTFIAKWKQVLGRNPPIDQELKERQIHAEEQRDALHRKVEEVLAEVREGREEDRKDLYRTIGQRNKELSDKLEKTASELSHKIETSRDSTNEEFRRTAVSIGKLEQLTTTHTQQLAHVETAQQRILERLPRKS